MTIIEELRRSAVEALRISASNRSAPWAKENDQAWHSMYRWVEEWDCVYKASATDCRTFFLLVACAMEDEQ